MRVCVGVCVGVGIEKETYIKRGDFLKFGILTWLVGACLCAQYLPNIYKFNLLNKSAITILNIKKNYVHNIYTTYFVIMSLIKLLLFMHTDIHLFVLNNSNPYQSPLLEKKKRFLHRFSSFHYDSKIIFEAAIVESKHFPR